MVLGCPQMTDRLLEITEVHPQASGHHHPPSMPLPGAAAVSLEPEATQPPPYGGPALLLLPRCTERDNDLHYSVAGSHFSTPTLDKWGAWVALHCLAREMKEMNAASLPVRAELATT